MTGQPFGDIFAHEKNPLLEISNPFEGYNKSIEELKNKPEIVQFDRMCYELFEHQELGQKFMEYILINKILKPSSDLNNPMLQIHAVWHEGYKAFYYMLMQGINSHKQRIHAENKTNVEIKK